MYVYKKTLHVVNCLGERLMAELTNESRRQIDWYILHQVTRIE